jgi:hypothetical protein
MTYIETLQDAIRKTHGCGSRHTASIAVHETFHSQIVWEGFVEVFDLIGHPTASQCFAWGHPEGNDDSRSRYMAVLRVPPIDSPVAAIRAFIASEFRR